MTSQSPPTLDALAATAQAFAEAVADLAQLDDVTRAAAARRLAETAHARLSAQLAAIADQATYDATRASTQPTVAAQLGVSVKAVEGAVTRHRRRTS